MEIETSKFSTLLTFYNTVSAPNSDFTSMTTTKNVIGHEYGHVVQENPVFVINGVQEGIREFTHTIQTRFNYNIDSTCMISRQLYMPDSITIVDQSFIINKIIYVGTENRFMVIQASLIQPNDTTSSQ